MGIIKRNACQRAHCNKNLSEKSLNINDKPCEDINEHFYCNTIYILLHVSLSHKWYHVINISNYVLVFHFNQVTSKKVLCSVFTKTVNYIIQTK